MKNIVLSLMVLLIASCSSTPQVDEDYKGVYDTNKSSNKASSLEVPPDLSAPSLSNAMSIPSLTNTDSSYSLYSDTANGSSTNLLPKSTSGVRFVREGVSFWLEINAKPDDIWEQVRIFFKDIGFTFVREDPLYGVLETDWLENRSDVPTGWLSSMLGGLFSSGLMDKYRIRLERTDKEDTTLMFITHQGLKEQSYGDFSETDVTINWEPRDSEPELEAEMLQRFLVFRGISKAQAKQVTAVTKAKARSKLVKAPGSEYYTLEVNEIFPRTWRRISIALDRIGLVIEDRNRSKGIYYIKTTEEFIKASEEDKSWLASIFSSSKEALMVSSYQLSVDDLEAKTIVALLNEAGDKDSSKTGHLILQKLQQQLR